MLLLTTGSGVLIPPRPMLNFYGIPANDDSSRSVAFILEQLIA